MRTSWILLVVFLALSGCAGSTPPQVRPDTTLNGPDLEPPATEVRVPATVQRVLTSTERWSVAVEDRVDRATADPRGNFVAYLVRRVNPSGKGDTFLAKVLDARSGKVVSVIDVKGFPALAWSPTGTLALGDDDGIRVLDFEGATTTSLPVVGAPRWLSPTVLSVSPWFGTPQVSLFRADGSAIPLPDGIAPTAVTAVAALGNSVSIGTETGELFQWSSTGWKTLHRANAGVLWMARDERMGTLFYSDGSVHRFNDQASALVWSQGVRRPWGQFDGKVLAVVGSELWAYQPEATPSIARRTSDGAALPSVPLPKGSTWLGNSQDGAMIVAGLPKGDQITQCIMLDQKGQTLLQQSLSAGGCELNDKGTVLFMWDETFLKMLDLKN